jgi:DHA2 family multidrug resistance protein
MSTPSINHPDLYLKGLARILSIIALSAATFLIVLDLSIANVSIPYISGDLGVAVNQGTYVITSFSVGSAIGLPMTGWLTKRIGAVRLIVLSIIGFVFFSALCGLSINITMIVISRFFQGLISGPLVPLSQSLLVASNPIEDKSKVIGIWSTIVVVGPVVGPILGGWISYDYTWPWIFYINIPVGIFSAVVVNRLLKNFETKVEKIPVDKLGFFLLAISASSFQFVLDKGEQFDWLRSDLIVTLSLVSVIGYVYFFLWEYFKENPIVDLSLFRYRTYSISILFLILMYSAYFGAIVIVPLWLQESMGYTAVWAGIAIAPLGLPPLLFSHISTKMIERYGPLIPLGLAFLFFALSSFYTAYFATNVDLFHIVFSRLLMGFGLAFFINPIITLNIQEIPTEKLPSGTGFFHFVRTICTGVGTSIFTTMWIRRQAFHHERLGSTLTPYNPNYQNFLEDLKFFRIEGVASLEATNGLVNEQSAMMAFNDIFYCMGWVFLLLILFLPLGRKRTLSKSEGVSPVLDNNSIE